MSCLPMPGEWDPCSPNPCGDFGRCIRLPQSGGFICNCLHGYSGTSCSGLLLLLKR
ncbi:unnamed protein product [Toxocara canis]|uniref:EGF-like domain-containing protein n=1 Tax=Toxocara canis TaxID=6265 RepID=A0A183VGK8_TOXCA|nr:unnamed protein product [Toxocara canis]